VLLIFLFRDRFWPGKAAVAAALAWALAYARQIGDEVSVSIEIRSLLARVAVVSIIKQCLNHSFYSSYDISQRLAMSRLSTALMT
jgi:hypothetical protein